MLNRRSFFLGLGSGLIIGSLLLELFRLGHNSQNSFHPAGRQLEQDMQAELKPAVIAEQSANANERIEAIQTSEEKSSSPQQSEQPTSLRERNRERLIRIEPGFNLTRTAELLVSNGILSDTTVFINQMEQTNKRVRAGYFVLSEGISVEEAIAVVTGQPLGKAEAEKKAAAPYG